MAEIEMKKAEVSMIFSGKSKEICSKELKSLRTDRLTRFFQIPNENFKKQEDVFKLYGYTMGSKIDDGGYSKVFKATNITTKEDFACKVVDIGKKRSLAAVKLSDMKNEIFIMSRIENRYVMSLLAHFVVNENLYIFMKLANYGTLFKRVKKKGKLPEKETANLYGQILAGLEYLHSNTIAHRDMKLENILLEQSSDNSYICFISDFGFSKIIPIENKKTEMSSTYCGTHVYMAPEVMLDMSYNAYLVDVWSTGVMLYATLNGSYPFDQTDLKAQLVSALQRRWDWSAKVTNPSKEVDNLLRGMLEPDTSKRYALSRLIKHPWWVAQFQAAKSAANSSR